MKLIPFDANKVPATLAAAFQVAADEFVTGQRSGFPVISIKGKVFHIKRGDEITLVTKPGDDDEAAGSIEVVVLKSHPGLSKTYYKKGYVEGSVEKPDCYSNDGIAPAADAVEAQAKKCSICTHNQWGSRITEDGKKAKACADVKRLAVAPAGQLNDPMLVRVPATSLTTWDAYVKMLSKAGAVPPQMVTKIAFDHNMAYPALTFKPVGYVTEDMVSTITQMRADAVVQDIIGGSPLGITPAELDDDVPAQKAKPALAAADDDEAEEPAPKTKPKAKPAPVAADDDESEDPAPKAKPKAKPAVVEVDDDESEDPAPKAKPKAKPAVVEVDDDITAGLDDMLAELGFDD